MMRLAAVASGILAFSAVGQALAQGQTTPVPNPARPAVAATQPMPQPADGIAALIQAQPAQGLPVIISVRIGEHQDRTRFVVEMSDPIKLRVFTLANPNRVVIDMPEVLWRLQGPERPTGLSAVKAYRYGLFRPGNARFVIDLNTPVTAAEPMVLPPSDGYGYRVVLDLFPTAQVKFEQNSGWPADLRARESAAEASLSPSVPIGKPQHKRVIVIDPGHGGIDSGTTGVDGLHEKDLVLDEGRRLAKVLQKRGYIVHLTRDSDIYIPLRERVNISRGYQADLFISLHADSNPDSSVQGASIYTLSEKGSDKEAAALASKENQSDIIAGVDLSGDNSSVASILIDLAQRDTMNRSSRFANTAVGELSRVTDILPRVPHRSAAFVVLKAPDVPAVLVELGYLSNTHDCGQMETDGWRNGVASAIADAVDGHFGPTVAGAPAEPSGRPGSE